MKSLAALFCLFASLSPLTADSLNDILARMDQAAPAFHALTATAALDTYQKIIDSHTNENGNMQMQRSKNGEIRALFAFTGTSDSRTVSFQGKLVRMYYPASKTYQDFDIGNNIAVVNQLLFLGFGSSGQQLSQSYTVSVAGEEKIAGQSTTRLLLIPKDPKVADHLVKAEIWIPDNGSNPLQQKFYEPTGNYRLITYTDIVVNPAMAGTLELKMPRNAKRLSQ